MEEVDKITVFKEQVEQFPQNENQVEDVPSFITDAASIELTYDPKEYTGYGCHPITFGNCIHRYPRPDPEPSDPSAMIVELGQRVAEGALWDTYQARIRPSTSQSNSDWLKVLVRHTFIIDFDGDRYYGEEPSDALDREEALKGVKREHEFYTEHLKKYQGSVIPKHYGTFISRFNWVCCMIIEDVGSLIGRDDPFDLDLSLGDTYVLFSTTLTCIKGLKSWNCSKSFTTRKFYTVVRGMQRYSGVSRQALLEWEQIEMGMKCGVKAYRSARKFIDDFEKKTSEDN
ncbi:uncharacterized protein L201_001078 [Kwoniella dendrophila CBS 6074]|uniref:Uncharacterized protein n=1 Tax=Kwoniella dendrophila CBS 6074 TaxID=1295534 RepID=A0AAX4JNT8_9TREE